ncbi:unnamed protein product [Protopolystoma xenopodis]|uniref:Uncharacterized protein n=1 Tax=Protopolystoma xenopodis TaxID=117903 RepID=A0A3S5CTG9_9PLAT|nr:unnamed protein product [Protopolystoma xenopodis]
MQGALSLCRSVWAHYAAAIPECRFQTRVCLASVRRTAEAFPPGRPEMQMRPRPRALRQSKIDRLNCALFIGQNWNAARQPLRQPDGLLGCPTAEALTKPSSQLPGRPLQASPRSALSDLPGPLSLWPRLASWLQRQLLGCVSQTGGRPKCLVRADLQTGSAGAQSLNPNVTFDNVSVVAPAILCMQNNTRFARLCQSMDGLINPIIWLSLQPQPTLLGAAVLGATPLLTAHRRTQNSDRMVGTTLSVCIGAGLADGSGHVRLGKAKSNPTDTPQ